MSIALLVGMSACSRDDGRTMKPPTGDQSGTIAEPTTTLQGETVEPGSEPTMTVTGPWLMGGSIESRYTCSGRNQSPPLTWSGVPEGTVTLALVLTDEDASTFTHWVVANIPVSATGLDAGEVIDTSASAMNSAGVEGYIGPCPPKGSKHSYTLTLYAVSQLLEVLPGDPGDQMITAIESAAIDAASTSFTFSR